MAYEYEIKTPEFKLVSDAPKGVIDALSGGSISVKDADIARKARNRLISNFQKKTNCASSELPQLNQIFAEDAQIIEAMKIRLHSINAHDSDSEG